MNDYQPNELQVYIWMPWILMAAINVNDIPKWNTANTQNIQSTGKNECVLVQRKVSNEDDNLVKVIQF